MAELFLTYLRIFYIRVYFSTFKLSFSTKTLKMCNVRHKVFLLPGLGIYKLSIYTQSLIHSLSTFNSKTKQKTYHLLLQIQILWGQTWLCPKETLPTHDSDFVFLRCCRPALISIQSEKRSLVPKVLPMFSLCFLGCWGSCRTSRTSWPRRTTSKCSYLIKIYGRCCRYIWVKDSSWCQLWG